MSFTVEPFLSVVSGHNSRCQKELREEKADKKRLARENKEWEEVEAVADEYEFQELLKRLQDEALEDLEKASRAQSPATTKTWIKYPRLDVNEYGPMEEQDGALLKETERLERHVWRLKRQIKVLQSEKRRYVPLRRPSTNTDGQQGAGPLLV